MFFRGCIYQLPNQFRKYGRGPIIKKKNRNKKTKPLAQKNTVQFSVELSLENGCPKNHHPYIRFKNTLISLDPTRKYQPDRFPDFLHKFLCSPFSFLSTVPPTTKKKPNQYGSFLRKQKSHAGWIFFSFFSH